MKPEIKAIAAHEKKKEKTPKIYYLTFPIIFLLLIILSSCENANISRVKNGVLEIDKSITVGQAFANYDFFKSVKWKSFTSDTSREVVEVRALYDLDEVLRSGKLDEQFKIFSPAELEIEKVENMELIFQFIINKDDTFGISWLGTKRYEKNGKITEKSFPKKLQMAVTLKFVYSNNPIFLVK